MERIPSATLAHSKSLVELLHRRADLEPTITAYTFLADGEDEELSITYGALHRQANAIATFLMDAGASGSRALLLYPSGLDYIITFLGCLYAGVVAVPAYPPRRNHSLERIDGIVTNAQATHILSTRNILDDIERKFTEHPHLRSMQRIATDELNLEDWQGPIESSVKGENLAFLQYTSGSTGAPKGVMVTHDNLMHNQRLMARAFKLNQDDTLLGWLPLYHDMGLIGNVLHSLFTGMHCVFMSPAMFLQKPIRWLNGVSRYGAAISGGPNFAYDLCVRNTTEEQREGLQLDSWRLAVNGSEPIRAATLDSFARTFAPYGFKKEALFPCYGLAEATLFVSGGPGDLAPTTSKVNVDALLANSVQSASTNSSHAQLLVSSGRSWPDQTIHIVDTDTFELCDPGRIGEIVISGGSVAQGYWQSPDATDKTFCCHIAGSNNGAVLRTGDLGFLQDGELFVTGRIKDMIIIRGRNHYPQDIESTVGGAHPALREDCGACFSVDVGGEESLVIVQEVERTAIRNLDVDAVTTAIRKSVAKEHELHPHSIVLLKTGRLPKTTSGKIQRQKCKADWLSGMLHSVGSSESGAESAKPGRESGNSSNGSAGDYKALLRRVLAKSRKVAPSEIPTDEPLDSLGLDSLDLAELKVTIENDFGLVAPSMEEMQDATLSDLALALNSQQSNGNHYSNGQVESEARDLFEKCATDGGYFGKYRLADDKYFTQPVLTGPIGPRMIFEGKEVIVWSINNYLGLARHPHIHDRARATLEQHGTWSPMGSRLMTGNSERHMALEARLAKYLGHESSIVFNFGYMGVMGTINSVVGESDSIIIDSLSHACIVDGAMLASRGKAFRVFRHNDMDSLRDQLDAVQRTRKGGVLVVTEGLFGMTGDLAPLKEICDLKDEYGARLFIDDAHGFGVMGESGAGTAEHLGVQDRIDLYFGTFAKSFAAIGGVTAGDKAVVDYIRYNARPNVFAKSLPMVYVDAVDAAFDLIESGHKRRDRVWEVSRKLQAGLTSLGYEIGRTPSPITPVYIPAGDEETAVRAMKLMRSEYGVFVSAVTYPVVPRGTVLFRLTSTAAHTDEDVERTIEAFGKLREQLNLSTTPPVATTQ